MFAKIAAFELRYQLRNPVFWVAAVAVLPADLRRDDQRRRSRSARGGNVHKNAPFAIAQIQLIMSRVLHVRDDRLRRQRRRARRRDRLRPDHPLDPDHASSTTCSAASSAPSLVAALWLPASCRSAIWLGSLMPWVDPETLGPNRLADYLFAYFVLALPNLLITSAIFFALATVTRSMMATYLGVVALPGRLLRAQRRARATGRSSQRRSALVEPFGVARLRRRPPATGPPPSATRCCPISRARCSGTGCSGSASRSLCLALAYCAYRFADQGHVEARAQAAEARAAAPRPRPPPRAPRPAAAARATAPRGLRAQLVARTRFEMKQVFQSPAFVVLMALGPVQRRSAPCGLGGDLFGTPTYPVDARADPAARRQPSRSSRSIIAIYYAGELVWRERDRKMHEIIDATPLPNWALWCPRRWRSRWCCSRPCWSASSRRCSSSSLKGYHRPRARQVPALVRPAERRRHGRCSRSLAVFVQALQPAQVRRLGRDGALHRRARSSAEHRPRAQPLPLRRHAARAAFGHERRRQLLDRRPGGSGSTGARSPSSCWCVAHLLWRRGTETRLKPRLQRAAARGCAGAPGLIAGAALLVVRRDRRLRSSTTPTSSTTIAPQRRRDELRWPTSRRSYLQLREAAAAVDHAT